MELDKQIAFAIIEFLGEKKGQLKSDAEKAESLDVAIQCLSDVFQVDPSNAAQVSKFTLKPNTLQDIMGIYFKKKASIVSTQEACSSKPIINSEAAEEHKRHGNEELSKKNYELAIQHYSQAIECNPENAVYYCNRAAANAYLGRDTLVIDDCQKAISLDNAYNKAYVRLGLAQMNLEKYQDAISTYERALVIDPSNESLQTSLLQAKKKLAPSDGSPANMPGGAGGPGLDFASMMKNPQLMKMAQEMVKNGGLSDLLKNPNIAQMAQNLMGKDPETLAKMAEAFSGQSPN